MVYLLQVFFLFAVPVFALTGAFVLGAYLWTEAQDYRRARREMHRITRTVDARRPAAIPRAA